MQITNEQIEKIRTLTEENDNLTDEISEIVKFVKSNNKEHLHKVTRNGQEQEVQEQFLWAEIDHLGIHCEAGQVLEVKYPELFEKAKRQEVILNEMIGIVGFDFRRMTLLNTIDLILSLKDIK